jgi:hypothetical protein
LRGLGLLEDAYVYNVDEPPEEKWDTVRNNYRFVKSVEPDLKTWLCLNQPKAVRDLHGYTDILDVYIRQYKSSGVTRHLQSGKQLIWAVCVWPHEHPNLFIEYPGEDARAIGWLTYRYGISGFEYWGLNQWGRNTVAVIGRTFGAAEHGLRGRRLKSLGETDGCSVQEIWGSRYRRFVSRICATASRTPKYSPCWRIAKKKEADALAASLTPAIESYSLDPAKFQAARLRLLELLRTVHSSAY